MYCPVNSFPYLQMELTTSVSAPCLLVHEWDFQSHLPDDLLYLLTTDYPLLLLLSILIVILLIVILLIKSIIILDYFCVFHLLYKCFISFILGYHLPFIFVCLDEHPENLSVWFISSLLSSDQYCYCSLLQCLPNLKYRNFLFPSQFQN